jgi:hypothetical protein
MKICQDSRSLIKIGKEYRAPYVRTDVRITVYDVTKSPQQRPLTVKWYQAVRLAEEVSALRERPTM